LELDGAPDRDVVTDGETSGSLICSHDTSNEEVTSTKIGLMLVDHSTNVQPLVDEQLLVFAKAVKHFFQPS
tara:strand:- start:152 stop:364 length:213 start_codon:yes stop_codon:yes gene_type:complete